MASEIKYVIDENGYSVILDDCTLHIGEKVAIIFDYDTGIIIKHGCPDSVKECLTNMIKCLSLASVEFTDTEFIKEVCNMKDALTTIEFGIDEIDLDLLNKFVNNTGTLRHWFINERN